MSKVYVKLYDRFHLTGSDFAAIWSDQLRRIVFSTDNAHSVSVVTLKDGTLLITNDRKVEFVYSISRNRRVLAVVRYRKNSSSLVINNNWLLVEGGVENIAIIENPDLVFSQHLNIEIAGHSLARVDFKVQDSGFACAVFTDRDLIFVRMNGNHGVPCLRDFIDGLPTTGQKVTTFMP